MTDKFTNLELIKEYPNWFLNRTKSLRVYRTEDKNEKEKTTSYRWHFGFPEELVRPFCPLLETTPFWGEQHWKETDGYWLWWLALTTKDKDKLPTEELNHWNTFYRIAFGNMVKFYNKG